MRRTAPFSKVILILLTIETTWLGGISFDSAYTNDKDNQHHFGEWRSPPYFP